MTDSILRMWDSKIPYIAHTIRQLLVYTYVTEGFNYAYNVSKYIPIELISTNRPNAEYDALCREVHYPDPSVNLGNYAENLRNAEKAVFDGNVDITPVMSLISRMKSDMNPVLLSDIQNVIVGKQIRIKLLLVMFKMLMAKMLVLVLILMKTVILRISILKLKLD